MLKRAAHPGVILKEELAETIIGDMSKRIGYDLKAQTLTRTILTPEDWQEKFNLYKGSGLGLGIVQGWRPQLIGLLAASEWRLGDGPRSPALRRARGWSSTHSRRTMRPSRAMSGIFIRLLCAASDRWPP